jgi:glycosyltransferase involved in cell wall biosynthesis
MTRRRTLSVFSDDWGRHPSSCQHLVSHLLDDFDVVWVNTIGTRPPRLDWTTLRRGLEKLRDWSRRSGDGRLEGRGPRVVNPLMWPSFRGQWQRRTNRYLLEQCLRRTVNEVNESVVLTTVPVVADLIGTFPAAEWIYYCVDDFSQWPGLDGHTLQLLETSLISRADKIVAAGENLAERIRRFGREPTVITHGVDLDHWQAADSAPVTLKRLASFERPVVLFCGLIDQRLDIQWLRTLANAMNRGSIVLIGPQQAPDPGLKAVPRLHLTGPFPYDELPQATALADVLIMPYADLPVTQAMQPLKLKEYLATGKPVVVRDLPATRAWDDCLDAPARAGDFATAVLRRCRDGISAEQIVARRRLAAEDWKAKARSLRDVILRRPADVVEVA